MALFKIFKGNAAKLPSAKTEGYMYIITQYMNFVKYKRVGNRIM